MQLKKNTFDKNSKGLATLGSDQNTYYILLGRMVNWWSSAKQNYLKTKQNPKKIG